jgi:hypothetical protein
MTSIERALITFVAASLGMAVAVSIAGGATNENQILATAYEPIPPGTALSLERADNADLTMQVAEQMRRQLQQDGYVVSDDSPLVLAISTVAPPSLDDDEALPMKLTGGDKGLGMRFKLIGTNSSGLLQETPESSAEDYQILLSVQDRRTDKYLWRGVAHICQCGEGILAASRQSVPDLAGAIGRTMGPQPVAFEAFP